MKHPVIVVNFKAYEQATGKAALELAKIHAKVAKESGVSIAIAVQAVDLQRIAAEVDIPVLGQHFDPVGYGAHTGHVSAQALQQAGAYGSLLNHAERKLPLEQIEKAVTMARDLDFFTIVCADTVAAGKTLSAFNPDLIAVEPPELIGGDISVSTAQPQLITDAVAMIGQGKVLVGAGIKTKEDVAISIRLGASGVLLASGITKSPDPEKTLRELVEAIMN